MCSTTYNLKIFDPFTIAPRDVIKECFSYLSDEDLLLRVSLVCKNFFRLVNEETIWKERIHRYLNPIQAKEFSLTFKSWKAAYLNFKQMKKEGKVISPTEIVVNGERLQGTFKNGKLHGEGVVIDPAGITWKGIFTAGNLAPHRTIIISTSQFKAIIAEGDFKDSSLTGTGKITYPNGQVEEGTFENGFLNGPGKVTSDDKTIEGYFKSGLLNGPGTITTSKRIDKGNFINGKLHGTGKRIYLADGRVQEGKFLSGFLTLPSHKLSDIGSLKG